MTGSFGVVVVVVGHVVEGIVVVVGNVLRLMEEGDWKRETMEDLKM